MQFSPETNCSNPSCEGASLMLMEATEEMLSASDGVKELEKLAFALGTTIENVVVGLCPVCFTTYYISL